MQENSTCNERIDVTRSVCPRIFLIDDHRVLTDALVSIFSNQFDIVGTFASGRDGLEAISRMPAGTWPEAVVMGISMPDVNGIEVARRMKKLFPSIMIVFLTMHVERLYVELAFQAGGMGYVLKKDAASSLVAALNSVLAGHRYLSPSVPEIPRRAPKELTRRQNEVLELTSQGKSAKEVAAILGICAKTVEFHKAGVMSRLGLHTTAELTRYAIENLRDSSGNGHGD